MAGFFEHCRQMGNAVIEAQLGSGVGVYKEDFHNLLRRFKGSGFRVIGSGF